MVLAYIPKKDWREAGSALGASGVRLVQCGWRALTPHKRVKGFFSNGATEAVKPMGSNVACL